MTRQGGSKTDGSWLQAQTFGGEPVYCEEPHDPNQVLYSGSDDEAYDSSAARTARCEVQAQRFLQGKPVFLLSASLSGPFTKESGWENPWRSKGSKPSKASKSRNKTSRGALAAAPRTENVPDDHVEQGEDVTENGRKSTTAKSKSRSARTSLHPLPSPGSVDVQSTYGYNTQMDLDTYVRVSEWITGVTAKAVSRDSFWTPDQHQVAETHSVKRKRAEGSGWLRRLNSKRTCPGNQPRRHSLLGSSAESHSTDEMEEELTNPSASSTTSTPLRAPGLNEVPVSTEGQNLTLLTCSQSVTPEELPPTHRRRPDAERSLEDPESFAHPPVNLAGVISEVDKIDREPNESTTASNHAEGAAPTSTLRREKTRLSLSGTQTSGQNGLLGHTLGIDLRSASTQDRGESPSVLLSEMPMRVAELSGKSCRMKPINPSLAQLQRSKAPRNLQAFSSPTDFLGSARKARGVRDVVNQSFQSHSDCSFHYRSKAPREKPELVVLDIPPSSFGSGYIVQDTSNDLNMEDIGLSPDITSRINLTENHTPARVPASGSNRRDTVGRRSPVEDASLSAFADGEDEDVEQRPQPARSPQDVPSEDQSQGQAEVQSEKDEEPRTQAWESVVVAEDEHAGEGLVCVSDDAHLALEPQQPAVVMGKAPAESQQSGPRRLGADGDKICAELGSLAAREQGSGGQVSGEVSILIDGPTLVCSDVESESDLSSIGDDELQQMEDPIKLPPDDRNRMIHDDFTQVRSEDTCSAGLPSTQSSVTKKIKETTEERLDSDVPGDYDALHAEHHGVKASQTDHNAGNADDVRAHDLVVEHSPNEVANAPESSHVELDASSATPQKSILSIASPQSPLHRENTDLRALPPLTAKSGTTKLGENLNQGETATDCIRTIAPPQSPWNVNDIVSIEFGTHHMPTSPELDNPSQPSSDRHSTFSPQQQKKLRTSPRPSQQSPWNKENLGLRQKQNRTGEGHGAQLLLLASQTLNTIDNQSPWRTGESQVALPAPQLIPLLSSPKSPLRLRVSLSQETPQSPTLHSLAPNQQLQEMDSTGNDAQPAPPSTPETKRSSLPTPDFTLSIKSMREFMTPSPERRKKASGTTFSASKPSNVQIGAGVLSNPWANTQSTKKRKRVSFAPLPGEDDGSVLLGTQDSHGQCHSAELPTRDRCTPAAYRPRAASPPPPAAALAELPQEIDKFGQHYAAVVARRTPTPRKPRRGARLLPSASQQACGSPAVEAMAEAFISAEKQAAVIQDSGSIRAEAETEAEADARQRSVSSPVVQGVLKQTAVFEEEQPVDDIDVSAVMDNLDDFLNLDAEVEHLAQANAERGRFSFGGLRDSSGLFDTDVWN